MLLLLSLVQVLSLLSFDSPLILLHNSNCRTGPGKNLMVVDWPISPDFFRNEQAMLACSLEKIFVDAGVLQIESAFQSRA